MTKSYIMKLSYATYYYKDEACTIFHREDGPAIEYPNGSKEWLIDGKRHREDGPAIEYKNGRKEWWLNGKLHRLDGPAIQCDVHKEWYLNGKIYDEKKYWRLINNIIFL